MLVGSKDSQAWWLTKDSQAWWLIVPIPNAERPSLGHSIIGLTLDRLLNLPRC